MLKNISPDSALSGRTCLANLSVWSCPVRKLIYPVRSSPTARGGHIFAKILIRILVQNSLQPIVSMVKDEPQTMKTASTNLVKLKVVEI